MGCDCSLEWLDPAASHIEEAPALQVVRQCEGLPLAIRAAGTVLASRERWSVRSFARRLEPENQRMSELGVAGEDLRCRLDDVLQRLSVLDQKGLAHLSVATDGLTSTAAARILHIDEKAAERILNHLVDDYLMSAGEELRAGGIAAISYNRTLRVRFSSFVRIYSRELLLSRRQGLAPVRNRADCTDAVPLLPAAERADDGAIEDADVGDVSRPRRRGAGRGLVVGVAWWSSGWRACGDHSVVTSATAARVEDSSTMALSAANAATRAWTARLLTARG